MNQYEHWRQEIEARKDFRPQSSEPEVGRFLFALARMIEAKRILEVGVWMGYTQSYLLEALPVNGESWAIDCCDRRVRKFELYDDRHHFVLGNSWEEIPKLPGLFDLAYLDTSHVYETTVRELVALWGVMAPGGLVCCHDVLSYHGVRAALSAIPHLVLNTPRGNGLAVIRGQW